MGLQKQQFFLPSLMAFGLPCDLGGGAGQGRFISFLPLPWESSSFLVCKMVRAWVWKALCGCLLQERVPSVTLISALWYRRHSQATEAAPLGRSPVLPWSLALVVGEGGMWAGLTFSKPLEGLQWIELERAATDWLTCMEFWSCYLGPGSLLPCLSCFLQ